MVRIRRCDIEDSSPCVCALDVHALLDGLQPSGLPLTTCQAHEVLEALPQRYQDLPWKLAYSTDLHGFSLAYLYRKLEAFTGGALLLVVAQPRHKAQMLPVEFASPLGSHSPNFVTIGGARHVFGAFLPEILNLQHGPRKFFGGRETFVFRFAVAPESSSPTTTFPQTERKRARVARLETFRWSGDVNEEFLVCSPQFFGIGGGKEGAAIFVESDLQFGNTSGNCTTFGSPSLCGTPEGGLPHAEFVVSRLFVFSLETKPTRLSKAMPDFKAADRSGEAGDQSGRRPALLRPELLMQFMTPSCAGSQAHHRCHFISSIKRDVSDDSLAP